MKYTTAIIGNGMTVRTKQREYRLSMVAHDAIMAGAKTANDERIARIESAYLATKMKLEAGAHKCVVDNQGLCHFCGVVMNPDWTADFRGTK